MNWITIEAKALFAQLKSKDGEPENFGTVFDTNGVLLTTLKESLENLSG